ncbi:Phosphopantetheine adenylyltransferase [Frankliniella fusca]|uniref:Phosphopantetheine adenylyltransferase n=1 Tax=Frankliniella fusca TaxID=407009 RepID=A0AAE1LTU2_9NEOP|nr:Phosphopantetheine adenylyltransferase [Frankliniella fusca]
MLTAARAAGASGPGQQQQQHQHAPLEHLDLDHLFLLPVRVLSMDSASLRKDLAGLDFNVHLLHNGPQGNVWLYKTDVAFSKNTRKIPCNAE